MKKLTTFVRNLLSVSPAEAKGAVIIFGIILLLIFLMFGADWFFAQKPQNLVISSPKMLDSLTVSLDSRKPNYNNSYQYGGQKFDKFESNKKAYKNFNFDPNTASVEQFEALGLPKFIAERIEKYRSKGGKFRKKEDFAKIYGLLPDTYERLEPYINLPSADDESLRTPQAEATNMERVASGSPIVDKPNESKEVSPKVNLKQPTRFDLNASDTTDFMKIKGIGSGYAKRIIKFRDMLGGFASAEQVRETYGLPPETADELLKYAFVKSGVRKLKVNQLSLTDFRHPYLKYFQAKAIIAYRDQHGLFKSAEDLKQVKVLDEATLLKILPYIEF
ncbi:competence protein ComEA [Emticicia aquatilis]|uniref:Competence protein ComEA n=1 Tax=Emticicia aquatilis TaxID=1537369 RepID=A0A917DTY8_9BACT|nr:helix-hairpin-helix domain-containing protein [Emticicia aquatilis]GGD70164.1 competence protein ComEA [Emticicia aquatilis]